MSTVKSFNLVLIQGIGYCIDLAVLVVISSFPSPKRRVELVWICGMITRGVSEPPVSPAFVKMSLMEMQILICIDQGMRKNIKQIIFLLTIGAGLIFLYFKRPQFEYFLNLNILDIFILLAASFLGFLVLGYGFKYILKIFQIEITFKEWFGLPICSTMFNYYIPARGGTVAKAYYLKRNYGVEYSYYISLMTGAFVIGLVLTSLIGLFSVFFTFMVTGRFIFSLATVFLIILFVALLSSFLVKYFLRLKNSIKFKRINNFLTNLEKGLTYFSNHKKLTLNFCVLTLFFILIMAVRLYLCFNALNSEVNFMDILMIRAIAEFSFLISLLPGNLGIKEGIIIFSAGVFGISVDQAITAAILDRVISMIFIFGFGFVYSKILLKKLGENHDSADQPINDHRCYKNLDMN